jgi:hypothetical protein
MFNANEILIDAFCKRLRRGYRQMYGGMYREYEGIICWVANMALQNIANSDALYHNVEHTIMVALVGQEILRGKHMREGGLACHDWLPCMVSLLCHDIGYVKGVCKQDQMAEGRYAVGRDGAMIALAPGGSDACLSPYHVDRSKQFVEERFGGHPLIDVEVVKRNIELTRFPVPDSADHQDTVHYPGLIRAADLIGQLSDPRYLNKQGALFYEFEEIGVNKNIGYHTPADLRKNYPQFYWQRVHKYVKDALQYLAVTQEGKQIIANLYGNLFVIEHERLAAEGTLKLAAPEPA